MQVVQGALKGHELFFDVINEDTLNLNSHLNMYPIISISDEAVLLTCPIAYYETVRQRENILELISKNQQIWYDLYGWGPSPGESDDPNAHIINVPVDMVIDEQKEKRLIFASLSVSGDSIMAHPDEFSSNVSTVYWYSQALREKMYSIIFSEMPRTVTCPDDPKSLFYCSLSLYCKAGVHHLIPIDFNDVKTSFRNSYQLVFYPSIATDSFERLVFQIQAIIQRDATSCEDFELILSVTLPEAFSDGTLYSVLRNSFNTANVHINLMIADKPQQYTADIVLLKCSNP